MKFLLILLCVFTTRAQISEHSGLEWNDMPDNIMPEEPVNSDRVDIEDDIRTVNINIKTDPDPVDYTTPEIRDFLEAAGFGNEKEMQMSLDAGLDINSVESRGLDTALHSATWGNHLNAVKFLIDNQADANIKNAAGYTPLLLAVRRESENSLAIMKYLLLHGGAKPWITNNNGNSALHWAAHLGRIDVTEWLLGEDGLNIDLPNDDNLTPLMLAATSGKDLMVKLLIDSGASYEMEGNFGRTPLEQASNKGNARVVQLLLKTGAVWKSHKDKLGDTALDLAKAQGHTQVEFLLEGRDPNTGEVLVATEDIEDEDVDAEPTDL